MQEFNPKLSDFGLAKAGPTGDRTHVSTQVMGTHGYAAPEYVATGMSNAHVSYGDYFLKISHFTFIQFFFFWFLLLFLFFSMC